MARLIELLSFANDRAKWLGRAIDLLLEVANDIDEPLDHFRLVLEIGV